MLLVLIVLLIILIVIIIAIIDQKFNNRMAYIYRSKVIRKEHDGSQDTIFVSIASYRDTECKKTLQDIFSKAKYPQNIYVGVYEQNEEQSECCNCEHSDILEKFKDNIKIKKVKASEARGPAVARYEVSKLYNSEKFFLQIDSHTRFIQDWDQILIDMYNDYKDKMNNDKIIITSYPLEYDVSNDKLPDNHKTSTTISCDLKFNNDGILQPYARAVDNSYTNRIVELPIAAAGFMFAKSFLHEVPFDPYLDYLFHGEELLLSVRLWSKGYRMYPPTQSVCFHFYLRPGYPKIWENNKDYYTINGVSLKRVKYILGMISHEGISDSLFDINDYLVPEESLDEYQKHFGIDFKNQIASSVCY